MICMICMNGDVQMQNALQMRLAEITEMIHVASLIHDDVLDEAEVRRGGLAVHKLYSNKVGVSVGVVCGWWGGGVVVVVSFTLKDHPF